LLGFVPRPGPAPDNVWGTTVTIDADGIRSNGRAARPTGPPVVAVGDSFTFGDEVDDADTWPARLERRLGRPVLNGGVFGYGLDQSVLRAERLLERTGAPMLVVSFVADDVRRCEYAYRYAWKPWFEPEDGALALRGVPPPEPGSSPPGEAWWRRVLRLSHLGDRVMRRLDPDHWMIPDSLRVHRQGVSVARLLVDRLADAADAGGHGLLLVHQWHPLSDDRLALPVLQRAEERGVPLLRLEPILRHEVEQRTEGVDAYFRVERTNGRLVVVGHMTPLGNDVVARAIERRLAGLERAKMRGAKPAPESR
jgi:hypothetical protein